MKKFEDFDEFDSAPGESVDIMPYVRKAVRHWKQILLWALGGMLVGILLAWSIPRTYTSRAVIAPELMTRSSMGTSLNTLASLAGISMNNLALSDAMHPDLYPSVIRSTNFYIGMFDMPVTIRRGKNTIQTDLYGYMVDYYRKPWWSYVLDVPRETLSFVKNLLVAPDEYETAEGYGQLDSLHLTRQQEMVIDALSKNISATVEKKTFAISLKVTMQDATVAAQVANAVVENLKQFVLEYRTEKARDIVNYYEGLYEEVHQDYLSAQRRAAQYADANLGIMTQSAKFQLQQLQNEAQLRYQMYNTTAQNLLAAKAKVQQEAPVLVVIQPGVASNIGKPSKVKWGILFFLLGGALSVFLVLRKEKE